MPTSLFVEHHNTGLAFYINGDLQFDTADEALYHEFLVMPTIALTAQRFGGVNLRVLICGGGDGLVARDVLRFPQVCHIDLVDYNPEVLELAKTIFKPYNFGSLENSRVRVYAEEAFAFVSSIADNSYHAIICDFTYPTCAEDTAIYSQEWFQELNRILIPGGVISTNGVSPENRTSGFWCLYQTLLSTGLMAKPLQVSIPSFQRHGYGNWGFFIASAIPINRSDLEALIFPDNLQTLNPESLLNAFIFSEKIAKNRHHLAINTLTCKQLYYYLLNPNFNLAKDEDKSNKIDFLEIQEVATGIIATQDNLALESMAKVWLEKIYAAEQITEEDIAKMVPVQHRYHSPKMTREWLSYLQQLLGEVDVAQLLNKMLERAQELPPKLLEELKELAAKIKAGENLPKLPPKTAEFITILSVTLLIANVLTPDAVFAKGYYSGSSTGTRVYSDSYYDSSSDWKQIIGFIMIFGGGSWLWSALEEWIKNGSENRN
ncbi:methyltransferase domain-containing protein [Ancylothrix sp. C2]|uniref:spermine/spermidine synthase domain-containing protein n=1 Tax=Ancylothrix sp. D3o TaxID=2953691 RepID=UPI0021BAEEBE|nr:methyltransferase domain-containing protein [Ancylothrix sp. D3o]MCT7952394.1 methyltransferase domain-containing protein [Ancylothrix sp. D3o]